jgi:hypothetical protein
MDKLDCKNLEERIDKLIANGIIIHDRRQVYIGADVVLDNVLPGTQLFPGTRMTGSHCVLGRNSIVGSEGPATLDNVVIDDGAEIASGFVTNSALLRGSRIGSNGHARACTILEEEASTAHAVGLKQTILMSYVTLGSLINFCDGIISGGRSRSDHTEIGSGFINFNFTPWGPRGDKATPTLVGDVYGGVFLNNDRIFLGGLSGIVGPAQVSFGALTVAGQVIRQDVGSNVVFSSMGRSLQEPTNFHSPRFSERKYRHNLTFIANLVALRAWYDQVRLARIPERSELKYKRKIISFAAQLIDRMIEERVVRLTEYLKSFNRPLNLGSFPSLPCPIAIEPSTSDHADWIRSLEIHDIKLLDGWLREIGNSVWPSSVRSS